MPWDDEAEREARYDQVYEERREGMRKRCRCRCTAVSLEPCKHCLNDCGCYPEPDEEDIQPPRRVAEAVTDLEEDEE